MLSGALLTLAFPEPDLTPFAWFAIAPLLAVAHGVGARRGAWFGFFFGLAFFGVLLIWVKYVGWIAWAVLVLLQAAFLALFGATWGAIGRRFVGLGGVLLGAAAWVAVEYLRQQLPVVGFTWGQLAQSQTNAGWILNVAGLGGGWGIAFLLVAVNGCLALAWRARPTKRVPYAALAVALVAAPLVLPSTSAPASRSATIAIVQGNVPRFFEGTIAEKNIQIINSHAALTRALPDDIDLVVWPESSVGLDMNRVEVVRDAVVAAARAVDTEMIVGANEDEGAGYKVLAYLLSPDGEVEDSYQKTHLVPFGEYVPWRALTGWIPLLDQVRRDAVPGDTPKVFETAAGPVAPVISFEGDFGSLVRDRIGDHGGRLLIVATNTSTWATSWASAQHVAFSRVRAAETGVFVVHAALSGISAFVEPDGDLSRTTELWTEDTLIADVGIADDVTLYARTGDWFPLGSLVVVMAALVVAMRRRTGTVAA